MCVCVHLDVFKMDPDFQENEEKYKTIKRDILDEGSSDSGEEGDGSDEDEDDEEENAEEGEGETNESTTRTDSFLPCQIKGSFH